MQSRLPTTLAAILAAIAMGCKREPPQATSNAPVAPPVSAEDLATPVSNAVPSTRVSNAVPTTSAMRSTVAPGIPADRNDVDITNDVRRVIASDPTLSAEARMIQPTTTSGVVQLTGTLSNEFDKENVRIAVMKVPGIRGVDNRIVVRK